MSRPKVLPTGESCIQPAMCPHNSDLIAFVCGQNVALNNAKTTATTYLTDVKDEKSESFYPNFREGC